MERYDYVKRLIEQLGAALARIAGLRAQGQYQEALAELREAYSGLDLNPRLVGSLDGASLARMLRDPDRVRALARLLEEEAKLRDHLDQTVAARSQRRQALALYRSLADPSPDAAAIAELERVLGS